MFCSKCGKPLPDDARFCPYCGQVMTVSPSLPPKKRGLRPWGVALIVLAAASVLTAAVILAVSLFSAGGTVDGTAREQLDELFDSREYEDGDAEERWELVAERLEEMERDGAVDHVEAWEENRTYTFTFPDGTLGGVDLSEHDDELNGGGPITTQVPARTDDYVPLGSDCRILILNGFENESYRRTFYEDWKKEWERKGVSMTIDVTADVSDFSGFADYDIVILSMHGYHYKNVPVFCTNETVTDKKNRAYKDELAAGQIVQMYSTSIGWHYWVLPTYFRGTYGSAGLKNCSIFCESCCAFGCDCYSKKNDYEMSDALIGRGAECVFGYHNSVEMNFSRDLIKDVLEQVIFDNIPTGTALENSMKCIGKNDNWSAPSIHKWIAYPVLEEQQTVPTASSEYDVYRELLRTYGWVDMVEQDLSEIPENQYDQYWMGEYCLYDMDDDGTEELLLYCGQFMADMGVNIFTCDGNRAVWLGNISAHYACVSGNETGLMMAGYHGGLGWYQKVTKRGFDLSIGPYNEYSDGDPVPELDGWAALEMKSVHELP